MTDGTFVLALGLESLAASTGIAQLAALVALPFPRLASAVALVVQLRAATGTQTDLTFIRDN